MENKTFTVTNYGGFSPEAKVQVDASTHNKFKYLDDVLDIFESVSPEIAPLLRKHYRDGAIDSDIDDRIAFISNLKVGLIADLMDLLNQ